MSSLLILPLPALDPACILPLLNSHLATSSSPSSITPLVVLLLPPTAPRPSQWQALQQLLGVIYTAAVQNKTQEVVLAGWEVDVLIDGVGSGPRRWEGREWSSVWRVAGDETPLPKDLPPFSEQSITLLPALEALPPTPLPPPPATSSSDDSMSFFPVVALGGSFDHLHPGHKILLSTALFLASRKIIVGVSDAALLTKKSHAAQLEPLSTRLDRVLAFSQLFKPGLETYDVVPIHDVYGPTATERNVQALVLSRETVAGGEAVDQKRQTNNLPPLQTFVIDVISALPPSPSTTGSTEVDIESKMSSSQIRRFLAERQAEDGNV